MSSKDDDPKSFHNLQAIAEGIGAIDEQIKALQQKKKMLEEELRPAVAGRGPIVFGDYLIEVKEMAGRKTIDKQKMIDDGLDVSLYEKVGKPFTQMNIKRVGHGDA